MTQHTSSDGKFKKGQYVSWAWGNGRAYGTITQTFYEKVTRHINQHDVTRNASHEEPAYLLLQDDGQEVLKSGSELEAEG
jgi:hypothetical protein